MRPFLLLYVSHINVPSHCFAEGLVHVDGSVYVRGIQPKNGELFFSLLDLKHHMRDLDGIHSYHIVMFDSLDTTEASGVAK